MLTWNRKKYLELLLPDFFKNRSSIEDYEFIIADNGSNDGSVELLLEYKNKYPKIRLFLNKKNKGLNEYKKIIKESKGEYLIIVDDDVISFPKDFDQKLVKAIDEATNYGFIALDVVQDSHSDGAKPESHFYTEEKYPEFIIEKGPTGGWCTIFRRQDLKKVWLRFRFKSLNMRTSEDGCLSTLFNKKLGLFSGILKNEKCLHASGPYYSKKFDALDRDIEKYRLSRMQDFVNVYSKYKKE